MIRLLIPILLLACSGCAASATGSMDNAPVMLSDAFWFVSPWSGLQLTLTSETTACDRLVSDLQFTLDNREPTAAERASHYASNHAAERWFLGIGVYLADEDDLLSPDDMVMLDGDADDEDEHPGAAWTAHYTKMLDEFYFDNEAPFTDYATVWERSSDGIVYIDAHASDGNLEGEGFVVYEEQYNEFTGEVHEGGTFDFTFNAPRCTSAEALYEEF